LPAIILTVDLSTYICCQTPVKAFVLSSSLSVFQLKYDFIARKRSFLQW